MVKSSQSSITDYISNKTISSQKDDEIKNNSNCKEPLPSTSVCNELVISSSDESDLGQVHKSCRLLSFSGDNSFINMCMPTDSNKLYD